MKFKCRLCGKIRRLEYFLPETIGNKGEKEEFTGVCVEC